MSKLQLLLAFSLTLLCLSCIPANTHAGVKYSWDFEDNSEKHPWKIFSTASKDFSNGSLNLHGGSSPHIAQFSTPPLPVASTLRMKIKSRKSFSIDIILRMAPEKESYIKEYTHNGSEGFQEYRFYLSDLVEEGNIGAIGVRFNTSNADISIASIKLYETTFTEGFGSLWEELWSPFVRYMGTINRIESPFEKPLPFAAVIGIITLLIFSIITLVRLIRKKDFFTKRSLLHSVALSFLAGGLLFSVRMDYNWLYLVKEDVGSLAGKSPEERLSYLYKGGFDDFFDFLNLIREATPDGEAVRPVEKGFMNFYAQLGRYYLLPMKTSERAGYLWAYNEKGLRYDRLKMTLTKHGELVAYPVVLVAGDSVRRGLFKIVNREGAKATGRRRGVIIK